jgi:hypothetical protein
MAEKITIDYSIPLFSFAVGIIAGYLQYGDLVHMLLGGAVAIIGSPLVGIVSIIPIIGIVLNIFFVIPFISSITGFTHWLLIDYWTVESIIINIIICVAVIAMIIDR